MSRQKIRRQSIYDWDTKIVADPPIPKKLPTFAPPPAQWVVMLIKSLLNEFNFLKGMYWYLYLQNLLSQELIKVYKIS